jgi:16S rRNA G966 N2-methylase RsmD
MFFSPICLRGKNKNTIRGGQKGLKMFDYEPIKPPLIPKSSLWNINGQLHIPKSLWRQIVESYPKEVIHNRLKDLIEDETIAFPYQKNEGHIVMEDYVRLCRSNPTVSFGSWSCPRTENTPLTYLDRHVYLSSRYRNGLRVSDSATQKVRMETSHIRFLSPKRAWFGENKNFLKYLLNLEMFQSDVTDSALRQALQMKSYIASQFKPECAKLLYNLFQAENVLDFSAGWGDRLVGFHASNAKSYIGIDPNTKLHEPYRQIDRLCNTGKETKFICSPAEEVNLTDKVDFVFTSPPYFSIERYSEEETQSWKRYTTTDRWLSGFLFPTLKTCWQALEDGGRIAVNISDAYISSTQGKAIVCQPMLDFMESLGAIYEGVIGYQMTQRAGANMQSVSDVFCEPIFIWSKGQAKDPKWDNFSLFDF